MSFNFGGGMILMLCVRSATLSEFQQLIFLEKEIMKEDKKQMSKEYYQFRISNLNPKQYLSKMKKKANLFLVAIKDNNIVGVARGSERPDSGFSLEFIGLKKQFRKKGIAPKLSEKVEKNVKNRNISKIVVQMYPDPVYASFFKSSGFSKEATLKNHVLHQDLDIFIKNLEAT